MIVGELFAGIGGIGLGLERAGFQVAWAIENDPYAAAVYRKNFPNVQVIEQDITTVDFDELERVDMIAGGFPCLDISYAGKGAGIEGERSGLWKEFWRAIRILRPRLVLVENVPALLSRGLGVIHGDLAALGYHPESDCIPAAAVGANHRRDRVFVVGHTSGGGCSGESRRRAGTEPEDRHTQLEKRNATDTDEQHDDLGGYDSGDVCRQRRGSADIRGSGEDMADTEEFTGRTGLRQDGQGRQRRRRVSIRGAGRARPGGYRGPRSRHRGRRLR